MHALAAGETVCPECGRPYGSVKAESFALKPGTILDGKYLVGEMLGQGGFGITYIGFDLLLEQKIAIKEYFPMSTGMVSREGRSTVVWSDAVMQKSGVEKGFDSFLKEARKMAKLRSIPSVVGVNSVFIQNETAYIVMDFIEGETLLKKLQREGPMDYGTCVTLMTPIMQALSEVHKHGIIHRDISPDNIMVQNDGRLILLDLGAAKDLDIQGKDGNMQSSQMVAKQGFSPVEQYGRDGKIGSWTDVYAMAATIYYCCTGILPPTAVDRIVDDTLTCQPLLTQAQFDVLAYCMSIRAENRPKNMTALLQMAVRPQSGQAEPPRAVPTPPQPVETVKAPPGPAAVKPAPAAVKPAAKAPTTSQPSQQKRPLPKWLIPVAAVVVLLLCIFIGSAKKASATANVHVMAPTPYNSTSYFWGQERYLLEDVYYVSFLSSLKSAPSDAWDMSDAGDGSILAWMSGNNLYVASNGKIAPNPNASNMFRRFINLKAINFGDSFDTSNVTNMSYMFSSCRSLTNLDLSCFNTSKVTNMAYMFFGCSSLTSLDVGGFDTSNVTTMFDMFFGCSSLTSLDISGFKASRGTKTDLIFSGCNKLTDLQCSDSKILWEYKNR